MIFKQINSSVDKTRKTLALFNKDWNTYKTNWQNANGIGGKIGSIFTSSNTNASVISNEQLQILRNWNNAVTHGCTNQETFNRIIANADDNTKMYFAGLNKGKGSIEGLKKAQNVATQSTIGLTIAQTALNMAISLGLTALISLIVKGYDKLANSVENCKECVDDLISSHKSALETANNNANRVEELADKYEKLSKGINGLGENVSLTNEEYEEYNSLVNEIAEMFPTLVQGWTDEGTAVLNLKGNVEQLRDVYKEAQQEAYNLLITSGKDSDGNDIIKQWEDTHDTGFWADLLDLGADDVGGGISVSDALKQLKAIQNMTAEEYREIERITGAGSQKEIAGLSDIEKDIGYGSYLYKALGLDSTVTDEDFIKAQRQARALIQTYNAEIDSALSDVETLANAYLMTNEDYDKLDAQSKTAASLLVNSLNTDIANKFSLKEDVGAYVDDIVQVILSNTDARDAIVDLFTMNTTDMPVSKIQSTVNDYINTIATSLDENSDSIKTRLGFDDSDTQTQINNVKEKLQDQFDNRVGELTLEELQIASEQIESPLATAYIEIPENALLSWDELIAKIKEYKKNINKDDEPTITSLSDLLTEDENQKLDSLTGKMSSLGEAYQKLTTGSYSNSDILQLAQDFGITADNAEDLAELVKNKLNSQIRQSIKEINELEAGTDNPAVLEQLETVKKSLMGIGEEAQTARGEVNATLRVQVASDIDTDDTLNALGDIKPAISSLGTLYDEYQDKDTKTFSLDAIANLNTELGELDLSSYKEFMEYLNETGNKADKADVRLQKMFDNILSEYISASGILDTVTDDNKNIIENILEQWGVLNAGEIVSQAAEANRQYEEEYKIVNENEYEVNGEKVKGLKGLYEEYYNALLAGDYETMDEIESIADGLINELSGSYQTDLENWKDLLVKKKEAYETFDKELNKRMGDDYDPDKSAEENVDAYIAAHPNLSPMDIASLERDAKIYDADIETSKNAVDKKEGTAKYKKNKGKGEFNLSNIKLSQSDSSKNEDKSSSSDKENNTEIDWLSRYTDVVSKKIDRLKAKYENLFTVKAKNNNLDKQLKNTEKLIKAQTKAIDIYKTKADNVANSKDGKKYLSGDDNLLSKIQNGQINGEHRDLVKKYGENAAKQIEEYQKWWDKYIEAKIARQNQEREKRAIQEQQYQNYVDDAQAKIDKSDALIELNSGNSKKQNNQLDNQKEYLKDSYKYQIKIAELNGEIIKAEQLKLELKQKLRDIEKQKFDNIQNQYSNEISLLENAGNKLSNEASLLEARGAVVTTDIYTNQIKNQQEIKTALQEEKVALQKQLATIKDGTDAWYEAKNALDDVDSEIDSCNTSIVEMYNNITELSRNIYDNLISAFHSVTDEADFVASLMSNRNMFNNEDGQITDEGLATLGTYVSGYYTSMQTADKIGDVIVLFDKELEKAKSYDFTNPEKPWHFFNPLTNSDEYFSSYKEMESYKEKLYQGQREEISKTYEYENKVIDMVKKNLESELSIMQKLVDSKKDALQATKDLHDYEKTIANSTKNISSIQKQIAALQGDNSEEGRARVQKLQKELEDAQEDLKETEYEHLISAQQDMLDNLIDEYETALNEEMSDVEHLLKKGIGMTNDGLDTINDTIDKYCNNYDYKLENIDDLYSNTGSIDNNVAKILDEIKNDAQNNGNTVTNNVDTVLDNLKKGNETLLNNVKGAVDNLLSDNKDKDIITEEFAVISNKTNEDTIGSFMETNGRSVKKDKYENVSKRYQNAVNEKLFEKYKKYLSLEKLGELAIDTLGISSKKSNDFSADGALYKELSKLVGFKHGGIAKFVKAHGEDGIAMVRNGEGILTPQMADTFTYDLIPRMDDIINASKILADIPAMTETTAIGNIEANFAFNLENVRDANDLIQQMQTNQNVRKAMQEVTIKQLTSSGTRLGVNSYH